MKKIVLLIAFGFLAIESHSQIGENSVSEKLLFGVKAGLNNSNVYSTQGDGFSAEGKFGYALGMFVSIPIIENIGIQPELLLSQKGFKGTGNSPGNIYNVTRTTTYLDIPLLATVKPVSFITLLAGPHYSYLLNGKYSFGNASTTIAQEEDFINEDSRKSTLGFGGGLDINVNHFVISARAFWDLQKNRSNENSITPRYNNTWYQATLGYRFY